MFDKDQFIQDCINAIADGQGAIREVVEKAVSNSTEGNVCVWRTGDMLVLHPYTDRII